jgi:hypothetical protein
MEPALALKRYLEAVRARFGYLATWLPNSPLKLGDVGTWSEKEGFRRETSLQRLGLAVKVRRSTMSGDLDHASLEQVKASVGLSGPASIQLGFGSAGGFVFHASGCTIEELDEVDTLGVEIMDLFRQKIWQPSWVLVDTVVKAQKATIIVSESNDASLEVTGPADLTQIGKVDLAITAQSGSFMRFVGEAGLTPLFRGRRVARRLFGLFGAQIETMRGDEALEPAEFEALEPLDFMDTSAE